VFELAVGVNGLVWFRSSPSSSTGNGSKGNGNSNSNSEAMIMIRSLLLEGEGLDDSQAVQLVDRLARRI